MQIEQSLRCYDHEKTKICRAIWGRAIVNTACKRNPTVKTRMELQVCIDSRRIRSYLRIKELKINS
jgi:hypothetical protein